MGYKIQNDILELIAGRDDTHQGIVLGQENEPFYRVRITPQGEVQIGNGFSAPTPIESGGSDNNLPDDVSRQASWDPAPGANNDTAFADAIAERVASGNGTVRLPKLLLIAQAHLIPTGINLRGRGAYLGTSAGTEIRCTAAGAGLRFGDQVTARFGGRSGDFYINGNNIATNPFYVGVDVARLFESIDISKATDIGLLLEGSQNCLFNVVNVAYCPTNYKLDRGAFTNHFLKCESSNASRYHLHFAGNPGNLGLANYPGQNVFATPIFERADPGILAGVLHEAGTHNVLADAVIADNTASGGQFPKFIQLTKPTASPSGLLHLRGVNITSGVAGNTSAGIDIGADCSVILEEFVALSSVRDGFIYADTATVYENTAPVFTGVTNRYVGTASFRPVVFRDRRGNPTIYRMPAGSDYGILLHADGDARERLALYANGDIQLGSGAVAPDVLLRRIAANVAGVGTDDMWRTGSFTTAARPAPATAGEGSGAWDTTLKRPIWSDASNWHVMATKAEVDAVPQAGARRKVGHWLGAGVVPNNATNTVGHLAVQAFLIAEDIPIDRLGLWVTTAAVGGTFAGAIYLDNGDEYPGALLVSATFDTSVANGLTATVSATIPKGLVWLGGLPLGAAATLVNSFGAIHVPTFPSQPSTHYPGHLLVGGGTLTALPDPFPAGATIGNGTPRLTPRMA